MRPRALQRKRIICIQIYRTSRASAMHIRVIKENAGGARANYYVERKRAALVMRTGCENVRLESNASARVRIIITISIQ